MIENIKELKKKVEQARNIIVLTHTIPDGDAIGSSFALVSTLRSLGKNAFVVLPEPIVEEYKFFDINDLVRYDIPEKVDLIISTDCPTLDRLGVFSTQFKNCENTIAIDHHLSFESFAALNFVNPKSSSACEFLYDILTECDYKINKEIAEFLYLGILRDTGGFMHDCTSSHTFNIASDLLQYGIRSEAINRHFMLTTTFKNVMLLKTALENLNIFNYGQIAIATISNKDLKRYEAKVDDTGAIVNQVLAINTVQVAMLVTEIEFNTYKVSIRSKSIDANDIANDFGGGGHKKASGCRMYGELGKVINALKRASEERLKKWMG